MRYMFCGTRRPYRSFSICHLIPGSCTRRPEEQSRWMVSCCQQEKHGLRCRTLTEDNLGSTSLKQPSITRSFRNSRVSCGLGPPFAWGVSLSFTGARAAGLGDSAYDGFSLNVATRMPFLRWRPTLGLVHCLCHLDVHGIRRWPSVSYM
jgi:hypothetical protein